MIDDVLNELRQAIEKSKDALRRETAKLRTGRAHPSMLDSIRVDPYFAHYSRDQLAITSIDFVGRTPAVNGHATLGVVRG